MRESISMRSIEFWVVVATIFLALVLAASAETPCTGISQFVPYTIYGSPKTIMPIPLPAGKWDCSVGYELKSDKATVQAAMVSISQVANHMDPWPRTETSGPSGGSGYGLSVHTMPIRIENPEPKTFFVNAQIYYTGGNIILMSSYSCTNISISN